MTTTFEELIHRQPQDSDDKKPFNRLVEVLNKNYPPGWRDWEVNDLTYDDVFGNTLSPNTECRIRLAVPTVDLIRCFYSSESISERRFKLIKRKLYQWPLGRALLFSPPSIVDKIHFGESKTRFLETVKHIKDKVVSRSRASSNLNCEDENWGGESPSSHRSKRPAPQTDDDEPVSKHLKTEEKLINMFDRQNQMFAKLVEITTQQSSSLAEIRAHLTSQDANNINLDESFDSITSTQDLDEYPSEKDTEYEATTSYSKDDNKESSTWQAPLFYLNDEHLTPREEYDFNPFTTEAEAKLSSANPDLVKQGIQCQRLESPGWANIKYAEVQKKFQATPVFCNLKVNNILASVAPKGPISSILEKTDLCLGAISHGLFQQRQQFQEIYNSSPPEVKSFLGKNFLAPESSFKKTSDALLQYVCGRRAETFQARRSAFKGRSKSLHEILHNIPPSSTHLFTEEKLTEAVKEQGGVGKFFLNSWKKRGFKTQPSERNPAYSSRKTPQQPRGKRQTYKQRENKHTFPGRPQYKGQNQRKPGNQGVSRRPNKS